MALKEMTREEYDKLMEASDKESFQKVAEYNEAAREEGKIQFYGGQTREPLENTGMEMVPLSDNAADHLGFSKDDGYIILKDGEEYELWTEQDDYSGYVIEIDGTGYNFVRSLTDEECKVIS